jgi:ABC-2 type transport system permease protein
MSAALRIAREEWRLWARSRVVLLAGLIVAVLVVVTSTLSTLSIAGEAQARAAQQASAEATFLAQPDRHPHRMVHYGHYAFRTPPPLAAFDPGVDAVTGQSIFLEGHRQNTAMFADTRAGADLGGFAALTPASIYQLLLPLLLIIIGHGVLLRERESGTLAVLLAQGQSAMALAGGKALALAGVAAMFMLPVAALATYGVANGEPALTAALMVAGYGLYLAVWASLILAVSLWLPQRSVALGVLVFVWLLVALVVPRIGINAGSASIDAPGKIESDLVMLAQQRKLGDGHNAADPAFVALQRQVLEQYGVDNVEQLPMNWRGMVAGYSEKKLTDLMNDHAEKRMAQEAAQSRIVTLFGLASPALAVGAASRTLAGTDLATHHRFLRESEALRFDFVQGLNELHANRLTYADDAARSSDPEAEARTRVNAASWRLLDDFRFAPDPAPARAARAALPLAMLLGWLVVLGGVIAAGARRLRP